jgi:putative thioredoxin
MNPNAPRNVVDVTEETFEVAVLQESYRRAVVVDFWAAWCAPCRALAPVLEALVEERGGQVLLAKVNADACQDLAAAFRIAALPTVKAFRNGALVHEFEGVLPEAQLRGFLDAICTPGDSVLAEARAVEGEDDAAAERLYRQALAQQEDNDQARLGLARVLLNLGRTEEIPGILEPVAAEGDVGAEADSIKARLALGQLGAGSAPEAVLRQRIAADPKDARAFYELGCVLARKGSFAEALGLLLAAAEKDFKLAGKEVREAMVQVFYALGSSHPLANEYRSRLARLLY